MLRTRGLISSIEPMLGVGAGLVPPGGRRKRLPYARTSSRSCSSAIAPARISLNP